MFDTHFKGQKGLFSDSLIENKTLWFSWFLLKINKIKDFIKY